MKMGLLGLGRTEGWRVEIDEFIPEKSEQLGDACYGLTLDGPPAYFQINPLDAKTLHAMLRFLGSVRIEDNSMILTEWSQGRFELVLREERFLIRVVSKSTPCPRMVEVRLNEEDQDALAKALEAALQQAEI